MKTQTISREESSAPARTLKRILAPTDFSPLADKALHYACGLAQEFGAEVVLLHVIEPEVPPCYDGIAVTPFFAGTPMSNNATKTLNALAKSLRIETELKVNSVIRRGFAAQEITDAAREFDVDLIVISTHGYTGWKHFCIGSTAERVARTAYCPVLVVREKEHDFI